MAEAWANFLGNPGVEVWSAGSKPSDAVNPKAALVMLERGIDITGHRPKGVQEVPDDIDLVVTLCDSAAADCPVFAGADRVEHWGLPDPADAVGSDEEVLGVFRNSRDDIERRVTELFERLQLSLGN